MDRCVHICKDGHLIFSRGFISGKEYCEICGAEMLDRCESCGNPIKTWETGGVVMVGNPKYDRPAYCRNCGSPYPWTLAAINAATEIIEEEEGLDDAQREKLISSIPDFIAETPRTQLAVTRFKKFAQSAGKFTLEALRQFVIDFGCEFARQQLGL